MRITEVFWVSLLLGVTKQPPQMYPPPGFKELMRTIWSLIRPNRVLNFLGYIWGEVHV